MRKLFWAASGLIVWTHAGYPALLALVARRKPEWPEPNELPSVSLIIAAYNEADVIARKIANARALDYPDVEVIVSVNASTDGTADAARAAGADVVIESPEQGKVRAQDRGVERARGEILAFSDANSTLAPDSLRKLVAPFADPQVGYVCGQVRFHGDGGNQEGLYWRYEMKVREMESALAGVTGGNGAIYATRRDAYVVVDERMGHDFSFPFNMVKRGWRAVYQPSAVADEKMTPTIETEFARKRRMASHTWAIVFEGGLLSPRGYGPMYALEIFSHRILRYASPFLHLAALAANAGLLRSGRLYRAAMAAQLGLLAGAAGGARIPRYYVLITASQALGLWDWLRTGTAAGWEKAEGTR